jgi:hypothetical protein
MVMDRALLTNYPLRDFDVRRLAHAGQSMIQALGIRTNLSAAEALRWSEFGVRSVAITMDAPIPDPAGTIKVMQGLHRAGTWAGYRTTSRWKSGTREVQVYCKGPELRAKLSKDEFAEVDRRHGPLDDVLRFEVTLGVADIKNLFGLSDTTWLPKLDAVNQTMVFQYVLYDEVYRRLKIRRVFKRPASPGDRAMALTADLLREAHAAGEQPSFAALGKLVLAFLLLSQVSSTKELCEQHGFARASVNTYKRELVARGFPPGVGVEPRSQRLIGEWIRAVSQVVGAAVPKKPTILDHLREPMTISAPWLLEHDITRSVPGISVDDGDVDPIVLEVLEALAG